MEATSERKAAKKEKVKRTAEGGRINKMTFDNIDYNVCSQDISKRPFKTKQLNYSSVPKSNNSTPKKNVKTVHWKDLTLNCPLTEVREIPSENRGCKVGNKKDIMNTKLLKELNVDDIMRMMLTWNPNWIKEQKEIGKPPDGLSHGYQLQPLPSVFTSFEEYRKLFIPVILYELWAVLSRDIEEKEKRGVEETIPGVLEEASNNHQGKFTEFFCYSLLTEGENRKDIGQNGCLVSVSLVLKLPHTPAVMRKHVFGYVMEVRKDYLNGYKFGEREHRYKDMLMEKKTTAKESKYWVRYLIRVKKLSDTDRNNLQLDKVVIVKFLTRIRPEMRKAQALLDLHKTKMVASIINPDPKTMSIPLANGDLHSNIKDLQQFSQLNETQRRVIVGVSRACLSESKETKICLVQGPPGTGKSSTICGILLQILNAKIGHTGQEKQSRKHLPRILVCAPSNAAVDSLVLKLVDIKESLPDAKNFNFIRLGITKNMNPNIQKHSFEKVLQRMVDRDTRLVFVVLLRLNINVIIIKLIAPLRQRVKYLYLGVELDSPSGCTKVSRTTP